MGRLAIYAKVSESKSRNMHYRIQRPRLSHPFNTPAEKIMFLQRTAGNQAVQKLALSDKTHTKFPNYRHKK
ncbi:hypothetical protein ACSAZK_03595 [Methanosarcina sp. Mfa9]|uniref:hypothetical protein n=1 Tax=Methanosarcina sp. Mfa9 TaxID=3439063 RepID=UPI003F8754C4